MMFPQLKQNVWNWRVVLVAAPTVAGAVVILRLAGLFQAPGWAMLDRFYRWRPPESLDPRIAIVTINESDLKQVGKWPISDQTLAELLLKIRANRPRAIGLDLYRDLPVEPGSEKLAQVYKSTPNLIGVKKVVANRLEATVPAPPILSQKGQVAANDIVVDADGKIRRGLLFLSSHSGENIPSFAFKLAQIYLASEAITPQSAENNYLKLGQAVFMPFEPNDGSYIRADAGGYQILLNYRYPEGSFRRISLTDVLENRMPKDWVRDRIVLIGTTGVSLSDFFYTPFSSNFTNELKLTPGIEIQANITSQILSAAIDGRRLLRTWSESWEYGWIFFWSCVGAILGWKLPNLKLAIACLIVASGSLVAGCYVAFLSGWWIPVIPPLVSLAGSEIAIIAYLGYTERQERQVMMTLFGRYVSPPIAEAIWRDRDILIKQGRLKGQKLMATVLFTDLKDFSALTKKLNSEELMDWLNEYMEAMSEIVLANGGVVDKFIGDAVMAVFGVPIRRDNKDAIADDAKAAVRCALEMAAALESLNKRWQAQGRPTTRMRVGIATGVVVAGSLGGVHRMEYTAIGDCVNLASRLESFDKSINGSICRILINKRTYQYLDGLFAAQLIGSFPIRGRQGLTRIYQVLPAQS